MYRLQKQDTAVDADAKQNMQSVDKAMDPLRIYPGGKNLPLNQAVNPGMVRIHITKAIRIILKGSPGKINHSVDNNHGQQPVFPPVSMESGPDHAKKAPDPPAGATQTVVAKQLDPISSVQQML